MVIEQPCNLVFDTNKYQVNTFNRKSKFLRQCAGCASACEVLLLCLNRVLLFLVALATPCAAEGSDIEIRYSVRRTLDFRLLRLFLK